MVTLYNTLSRRREELQPREPGVVRMYSCGPTVYRSAHLGNLRTYLLADGLRRLLEGSGYRVIHVKNITDVGHMRQELLERGEDKVIAAARAEGRTPQEIAAFYTAAFLEDEAKLNILPAAVFPRASDHVSEMIDLIERLLAAGYAYAAGGNVYFDVGRFPAYGRLSGNIPQALLAAVRVEADPLKRRQQDFTLWKAAEPGRSWRWPSPWGEGFPGWNIECSAMAIKYLGPHLDIHTGGVDNIFPHHEGEIAQSEALYGGPFVRCWVHGQHLLVNGLKMAKSLGNSYTLPYLEEVGFEPLAFRYLCLTVHYRRRLNFTFTALRAAQRALGRLRGLVRLWAEAARPGPWPAKLLEEAEGWRRRFWEQLREDLGFPGALATLWRLSRAALPPSLKLRLAVELDRALGLGLAEELEMAAQRALELPPQVVALAQEREGLRRRGDFAAADARRREIRAAGFQVADTPQGGSPQSAFGGRGVPQGPRLYPLRPPDGLQQAISSARQVPSCLGEPDACRFSLILVAQNNLSEVRRSLDSALAGAREPSLEVVILDNGSTDGTGEELAAWAARDPRLKLLRADHPLGEAEALNAGLRAARGSYLVLLRAGVEATGDLFTPIGQALADPSVGVVGRWGLRTRDLRSFYEVEEGEADAMQGYCWAFRRRELLRVGLMDPRFHFYRHLDLYFSFAFREQGLRILALPELPLTRPEQYAPWAALGPEEREKLSKRNFYRFLARWGGRRDLLVAGGGG